MIDLHSHILPGLDDGARTLDESLEMATRAVAGGVTTIVATPHVRDDYPTHPNAMLDAVVSLNAELRERGVPLRVLSGGEIALDRLPDLSQEERRLFGLGGNPRALLLEFPYSGWPLDLEFDRTAARGGGHPGRHRTSGAKRGGPGVALAPIVSGGALIQVTAGSCVGAYGRGARRVVDHILQQGWPCLIASDWHHPTGRPGLAEARTSVGGGVGEWLTQAVPASVIAGEPTPDGPTRGRARRLSSILRGGRA